MKGGAITPLLTREILASGVIDLIFPTPPQLLLQSVVFLLDCSRKENTHFVLSGDEISCIPLNCLADMQELGFL